MDNRQLIDHFSRRSASYSQNGIWVNNQDLLDLTIDFLDLYPKHKILDAGSGTGVVLDNALKKRDNLGACIALDISIQMLNRIKNPAINRCVGDLCSMPFSEGIFDRVLCRQVLHYIANLELALIQAKGVLTQQGAFVISQIVPFENEDEEFWFKILRLRQPLRKIMLTHEQLVKALTTNGFKIDRVSQIRVPESLNSWLSRYELIHAQEDVIRNLFRNAPESFRIARQLEIVGDDTIFDNCWTFIRGAK
jgi:ubiquinone/menaquinone biosynthesis C-methylase UbiE